MKKSAKAVILTIGEQDFEFTPTVNDHNNYTNEMMADNKVAPAYTFLTRTVKSEHQINIYEALGAPVPMFAHCAMILGDDGAKLSKRHGAVSVMQYRDELQNFIILPQIKLVSN